VTKGTVLGFAVGPLSYSIVGSGNRAGAYEVDTMTYLGRWLDEATVAAEAFGAAPTPAARNAVLSARQSARVDALFAGKAAGPAGAADVARGLLAGAKTAATTPGLPLLPLALIGAVWFLRRRSSSRSEAAG
jgi:hypothetical protein